MTDQNLQTLQRELDNKVRDVPCLEAVIENDGLVLRLDLKRGLEGYEHVRAVPQGDNYSINYFGLFSSAFDTFLRESYQTAVEKTPVLRLFRDEVAKIKREGKVEVYEKKKDQIYSQLIELSQNGSFRETEQALEFFVESFKDKAVHQKVPANSL